MGVRLVVRVREKEGESGGGSVAAIGMKRDLPPTCYSHHSKQVGGKEPLFGNFAIRGPLFRGKVAMEEISSPWEMQPHTTTIRLNLFNLMVLIAP